MLKMSESFITFALGCTSRKAELASNDIVLYFYFYFAFYFRRKNNYLDKFIYSCVEAEFLQLF